MACVDWRLGLGHPYCMSQAILIALSSLIAAGAVCALLTLTGCGQIALSDKEQLIDAAQTVTDAAFAAGAPVLNEAVRALPEDVQLLVQAGYGALRKAVEAAEAAGIQHTGAQAAVQAVAQTADQLHDAVHAPDTAAPTAP